MEGAGIPPLSCHSPLNLRIPHLFTAKDQMKKNGKNIMTKGAPDDLFGGSLIPKT